MLWWLLWGACVAQTPPAGYSVETIGGHTVYVERVALAEHPQETKRALALLQSKLQEIDSLMMGTRAAGFMKSVTLFMDWDNKAAPAATYHPSRDWLVKNGYIPEKAKCVNITNVRHFLDWTALNQPYMVLHEMSHAYHDQVLSFENRSVKEAFDKAMKAGLYNNVKYNTGRGITKKKAYATDNCKEYFAELSEAYWGRNDFYPFQSGELRAHDPLGYEMVDRLWRFGR